MPSLTGPRTAFASIRSSDVNAFCPRGRRRTLLGDLESIFLRPTSLASHRVITCLAVRADTPSCLVGHVQSFATQRLAHHTPWAASRVLSTVHAPLACNARRRDKGDAANPRKAEPRFLPGGQETQWEEQWEDRFEELKDWADTHGHCQVTRIPRAERHTVPEEQAKAVEKLCHWVYNQRKRYREGTLDQEKVERLEALGFRWEIEGAKKGFEARLQALEAYRDQHGDCHVSAKQGPEAQRSLGRWCEKQRTKRRQGKLPKARIRQLDAVGFPWAPAKEWAIERKLSSTSFRLSRAALEQAEEEGAGEEGAEGESLRRVLARLADVWADKLHAAGYAKLGDLPEDAALLPEDVVHGTRVPEAVWAALLEARRAAAASASASTSGSESMADSPTAQSQERSSARSSVRARGQRGRAAVLDGADYGLSSGDITPRLQHELDTFRRFCCESFYGQKEPPIRPVTCEGMIEVFCRMLGWMVRHPEARQVYVDVPSLDSPPGLPSAPGLGPGLGLPHPGSPASAGTASQAGGSGGMEEGEVVGEGGSGRIAPAPGDVVVVSSFDARAAPAIAPDQELSLRMLLPDSSEDSCRLVFGYLRWLERERNTGAGTELVQVAALLKLAKFLFHAQSDPADTGSRAYADIPVVKALLRLQRDASRRRTLEARGASELKDSDKWLDWPDYLRVVETLRAECDEKRAAAAEEGARIQDSSVAQAFHRYLIVGIFACIPDRQRTIRELELDRTLFREEVAGPGPGPGGGEEPGYRWVIRHGIDDYKTGKSFGVRPPMPISTHLYPYLEEYLDRWREVRVGPQCAHKLLFVGARGQPLSRAAVWSTIRSVCMRVTGKKTSPHLLRDMVVTHVRSTDASLRELEALALFMGHSVEMQKGTYDKRTRMEKIAPAVTILQALDRPTPPEEGAEGGQ